MTTSFYSAILLLWLIVIAVMDLRMRKVRNWMVLLGLVTGVAASFSSAHPFQISLWSGLTGMLVAFAALLPFYALRWMGAGDVKFAAVIGLWFGLSPNLLFIWLGGSLLAGLHGLAVVSWRVLCASPWAGWLQARLPLPLGSALAAMPSTPAAPSGKQSIRRSIPYAGYLAIAAICMLLSTGPELAP